VKISSCLWSCDDSYVITSSWLKKGEKNKTSFEVDIKLWNAATGAIEYVLNREETPVLTGPVRFPFYINNRFPICICIQNFLIFWQHLVGVATSVYGT
jgi:hypothetical protein